MTSDFDPNLSLIFGHPTFRTKVLMKVTIHFSSYIAVAIFFCLFRGEEYSFRSYSIHICRSPSSTYAIEESDLLLSVRAQEHTSLESSLAEDFII